MDIREVLKTRSWPPKLVPVVFVFLLVNYLRKHLGFRDLSHFWGVCNFLHFESFLMGISMGQFPDIEFAYYTFKSGKWIKQTPTPPFWGMLAWKSGLRFWIRALEVPFLGTWKWALLAKVPIFRCPKIGLRVPESKNWDHFFTPTSPQNGGVGVCFIHLPLLDA